MNGTIYLVRHATPDWSRTDLRYDIPPGPPLTPAGEEEARKLGEFLRSAGVVKLYASPLDRTARTAELAAAVAALPVVIDEQIAEWRLGEKDAEVLSRCRPCVEAALAESLEAGPIALVTHGGPIRLLLQALGLSQAAVDFYRRQFDRDNPLPPAGVWKLTQQEGALATPEMVFAPQEFKRYVPDPVPDIVYV